MTKSEFLSRFYNPRQVRQEPDYPLAQAGQPAAVLIPIVEHESELTLLLTERAHHLRHHPGQISFPGGKIEAGESPQQAAAREAYEEIALPKSNIEWIGELPNYRTVTQYEIVPLIGFVKPFDSYEIDSNEVANIFEVPFAFMCDPRNHLSYPVRRKNQQWEVFFIPYKEHMIWGATAAIIRNLSHHLHFINDSNPSD